METIIFKAPEGTKAALKRINPNISALLREQISKLVERRETSAHDKGKRFCGVVKGLPKNASTSKDYLKLHAKKNHR